MVFDTTNPVRNRSQADASAVVRTALVAVRMSQARFVAAVLAFRARHGHWPMLGETARTVHLSRSRTQTIVRRLRRVGVLARRTACIEVAHPPDGVFLTLAEARR